MRRNILTAALAALIAGSTTALAKPAASYFLDRAYWSDFDWDSPARSALWALPGWDPRSGDMGQFMGQAEKRRRIILDGFDFEAFLGTDHSSGGTAPVAAFYSIDLASPRECARISTAMFRSFGRPITNDGTLNFGFSPDAPLHMVKIDYQWDVGNTRISAACAGLAGPNVKHDVHAIWDAKFTRLSDTPKLVPKMALRCTQRGHFLGQGRDFDMPELPIWIDFQNKTVVNPHGVLLSKTGSFNADEGIIEFSIEDLGDNGGVQAHVAISRVTGRLDGTMKLANPRGNVTVTGTCEKVDSLDNKF